MQGCYDKLNHFYRQVPVLGYWYSCSSSVYPYEVRTYLRDALIILSCY